MTRLVAWARGRHGGDLITASAHADQLDAVRTQAARDRLIQFGTGLEHVRGKLDAGRSLGHTAIATVTLPGGLVRHYQHQRDHTPDPERRRDAERALEDLRSLCRAAQAYEEEHEHATLTGFLEPPRGSTPRSSTPPPTGESPSRRAASSRTQTATRDSRPCRA